MAQSLKWIDTTGGPHVLLAEELVVHWNGVRGWYDNTDPMDQSDYARACRVSGWHGIVPCDAGSAIVLTGDVGVIAWLPEIQSMVQWIASDGEEYVRAAAMDGSLLEALTGSDIEELTFSTGSSGRMHLFDSSEPSDDMRGEREILTLSPGRHVIRSGYFEDEHLILVVRQILPSR